MGWKKMCKVCEKDIDPGDLVAHADCKDYAKIVRYVKTPD